MENFKQEVKELNGNIINHFKNLNGNDAESFYKLYKGIQIFYSRFIYNPIFMLMGINPGAGYQKRTNKPVEIYEPLEDHEYFQHEYTLANQTQELFHKIGDIGLLRNSVKSNFCYFATENQEDLKKLRELIKSHLDKDIFIYSSKWTQFLIKTISPRIILCEGFYAYSKIIDIYKVNEITDEKNDLTWKRVKIDNGPFIYGYKRSYSNIMDKISISNELKRQLEFM